MLLLDRSSTGGVAHVDVERGVMFDLGRGMVPVSRGESTTPIVVLMYKAQFNQQMLIVFCASPSTDTHKTSQTLKISLERTAPRPRGYLPEKRGETMFDRPRNTLPQSFLQSIYFISARAAVLRA